MQRAILSSHPQKRAFLRIWNHETNRTGREMKEYSNHKSEEQAEWECNGIFKTHAPYYQVNTSHTTIELLAADEEEYRTLISLFGYQAILQGICVLAFEVMSTHLHGLYAATEKKALAHMESVLEQYGRYLRRKGRSLDIKALDPKAFPIPTLQQLRNEIAYVIRNSFVARPDVHVFADPHGSGYLYYNPMIKQLPSRPFQELPLKEKRSLLHTRDVEDLPGLRVLDGRVDPACFVDYCLVESLFPNARKFVMWTMKNVEAQVTIAISRGEKPALTDEELYGQIYRRCRNQHNISGPSQLTRQQKQEMALELKRELQVPNNQLARTLSLPLQVLDAMFPLSAQRG